jgi:hypothetical protein
MEKQNSIEPNFEECLREIEEIKRYFERVEAIGRTK